MTIFDHTTRPDDSTFFKRGDVNDIRLGETVKSDPQDYASTHIVLLGLPQDEGVQRNGGRIGASQAPNAIRSALYKLVQIPNLSLFDLGDTRLQPDLEATHAYHRDLIRHILADGKTVIVLGGGNDISYPDCGAVSDVYHRDLLAFNIDAHLDIRIADKPNSGTPYRQLLDEKLILPHNFHEIGYQPFANSIKYLNDAWELGIYTHSLASVQDSGVQNLLRSILSNHPQRAIFWGLDMDVVRSADAPGVSAPNPTGLSGEDICIIADIAGRDKRTRLFEISEVNPTYDIDGRTAKLAAATLWHFLLASTYNIRK